MKVDLATINAFRRPSKSDKIDPRRDPGTHAIAHSEAGEGLVNAQQDELCRHVIVDISLPSEAVERRAGHDDTGGVDVGGDDNDEGDNDILS